MLCDCTQTAPALQHIWMLQEKKHCDTYWLMLVWRQYWFPIQRSRDSGIQLRREGHINSPTAIQATLQLLQTAYRSGEKPNFLPIIEISNTKGIGLFISFQSKVSSVCFHVLLHFLLRLHVSLDIYFRLYLRKAPHWCSCALMCWWHVWCSPWSSAARLMVATSAGDLKSV